MEIQKTAVHQTAWLHNFRYNLHYKSVWCN